MEPKSLKIEDQLDLFYRRGVFITDKNKALEKLKHVSYYRLKDFARPYSSITMYGEVPVLKYSNITFEDIVKRYYQNKNLRINLLHAIEKIEVSIKRNISFILGSRYGAYGYLEFDKWANKKDYKKFELEQKQFYFKKDLLKTVKKSSLSDLGDKRNLNTEGFPTIWIATEILMFGELVHLIKIMSTKNQNELAKFYNCSSKELLSWLKCLNFARNVCAHNANIIDINLQTKPIIRNEWKDKFLYTTTDSNGNKIVIHKVATIILITITLVNEINKKYRWKPIRSNIATICKDSDVNKADLNANIIGFANSTTALDLATFANGSYLLT